MFRLPRAPVLQAAFSHRSWARPWRAARPETPRGGPRIAVIGNCQARGVARALEVLVPDSRVTLLPLGRLRRDHASVPALTRALDGFDHVFTQHLPPGFLPGGDPNLLYTLRGRATIYPVVVFPAYHPDMIYVGDLGSLAEAKLVPSPMGHYHSAIVLHAYLRGLDERRTAALFREEVLAALGYLDGWEGAAEDLLRTAEAVGFDLSAAFLRWARRGTFMHVFNHPRLHVLGDIARGLAEKSGLSPLAIPVEDYLADELASDVVWPVYGPIAERYGVPGSTVFKAKARGAAPPVIYDLEAFVAASFAIYRRHARADLACSRMETWGADARVAEIFGTAPAS